MPKLRSNIQFSPYSSLGALLNVDDSTIANGQVLVWDSATGKYIPADQGVSTPESLAFAYNLDGTVDSITGMSVTLDFTYNLDGSVDTIDNGSVLRTFSYNLDGTVSDITVS